MLKNFSLYLSALALLLVAACKPSSPKVPAFNPGHASYISSFTSGLISKQSSIEINLLHGIPSSALKEGSLPAEVLNFEPKIEGTLNLIGNRTLEFIPAENLEPGQVYKAELQLQSLISVPDSLKKFIFGFQVLKPQFEWGTMRLVAQPNNQMEWYQLEGGVHAADYASLEELGQLATAKINSTKKKITWQQTNNPLYYSFTVDSLQRQEKAKEITLEVNKQAEGTASLKNQTIRINAIDDFQFLNYEIYGQPSPHVQLNFSDPIAAKQNLEGLITLEGVEKLSFSISNTAILVYPPQELFGKRELNIFPGIKNILGYKYKTQKNINLEFKNEKPQVALLGQGNIMPQNEKLLLPFKAISLKAVDIKVVKIPESNVLQFFQTNNFEGSSELYRVGTIVAEKTIDLKPSGSLKSWNNYSLDLAPLMPEQDGSLYRVYLSFKKDYSLYTCYEEEPEAESDQDDYGYYEDYYYYDNSDWSAYNRYDYYFKYPQGYNWKERDNPCHNTYYREDNFITRNILSTNLGLIAKRTEDGLLDFTLSDFVKNEPVADATIQLYNYQGLPIRKGKTNAEGWLVLKDSDYPYFAVAEKGNQKVYLKLQEGEALSLSTFNVNGASAQKGLKGFIYGERGVWRPGDSIYLNFMLEDESENLPLGHPLTFTLSDPQGKVVFNQLANKGNEPIYNFKMATAPSAITGMYTARVSVGSRVFSKALRIEMVKPNRLKINLAFADKVVEQIQAETSAKLRVNWLSGLPAANAKVNIEATIKPLSKPFKGVEQYHFSDPVYQYSSQQKVVYDGAVGPGGEAAINLKFGKFYSAPGMLNARLVIKAFEGSGQFSTEYQDQKIAPYPALIGLKIPQPKDSYYLATDKDHTLNLKTLNAQGEPVSLNNLSVKVYKLEQYWWYNSRNENLARFVNKEATYLISQQKVKSFQGQAKFKLNVPYPNWGRFLVRVCDEDGGHCTGQIVYLDWPSEKQKERSALGGASILNLSTGKDRYEIDEEIILSIPTAPGAKVLVSVENGSKILKKEWLKADGDKLEYRLKATPEMAPNIYFNVSLLQAHAQTTNDRPMRLYGIAPVEVYNPATELKPVIETAPVWAPETTVTVKVSEDQDQEMYYTLAVVDDGLLNLTRFETPAPWPYFYAKEALGIKTWDMYNQVLGAFGGKLEQVFAIGGDEALQMAEKSNANRFKPMVRHLGPFKLKAGKTATHKIAIPNYVGSARVMVVAATTKSAYGHAQAEVKVRQPLMVLNTLPRLLNPGDELLMPVTVFAMEEQVKDVKVTVKSQGEVNIIGSAQQSLVFSKVGEKVLNFKLKVPENIGKATLTTQASAGVEKAYAKTELKVRLPNLSETQVSNFALAPGQDTILNYQPFGLQGTNFLTVEAATTPVINIESRLHYLLGYPHGCTEQIVSRALPLLFLESVVPLDANFKATKNTNVKIAIDLLHERQTSDGRIKYWPGSKYRKQDFYASSYAGHFLWEAQQAGYQLPAGMLARWFKFQQYSARHWKPHYNSGRITNDLDQSYRLYTLALSNQAEVGAMNRLREMEELGASALWQLAASYALLGETSEAQKLMERAKRAPAHAKNRSTYFGRNLRNEALKLMVLNTMGAKSDALEAGKEVAKMLNSGGWYTTHGVAFGLMAFADTYAPYLKKSADLKVSLKNSAEEVNWNKGGNYQRHDFKKNLNDPFSYTLRNNSAVPVNFSTTVTGTPIRFDVSAYSQNLNVQVRYQNLAGQAISAKAIEQGEDFEVQVTLTRQGNAFGYEQMALSYLFPVGWELLNSRLTETPDKEANDYFDYQDIRDDRVYTYFSMTNTNTLTFTFRFNATYAGKFYAPALEATDMYNHEIKARTAGQWVEVTQP